MPADKPFSVLSRPMASTPASVVKLQQPAVPPMKPMPAPDGSDYREFGDAAKSRQLIFDNVLEAARTMKPATNKLHTLELADVDYADPDDYSIADQKRAILEGKTLGRRLRGTWRLKDNATGNVLDEIKSTVARVPYLTDRGTFIHNGNEYTLGNQMRLRPGVFTRIKDNGEIEAHANIMPGKGPSHRYFLDPAKGQFYMRLGQAKLPLMPLLRIMGAKDEELREAWGPELVASNMLKDDPIVLRKLYDKLAKGRADTDDEPTQRTKLLAAMDEMELDPEITQRTLGQPFAKLDKAALLRLTQKLLKVSRGEEEADDRDHLANQVVMGPEDLFSERFTKDSGRIRHNLLWKSGLSRTLKHVQPGALTSQLEAALLGSGLGQSLEEINPADIFDKLTRITRLGEGGIPSLEAVPDEARSVQPSHLGFMDPIRTPESLRAGVDIFLANQTRKGRDGRIYSPFVDIKTGATQWKSPQDVTDMAVAFPGELDRPGKRVVAMHGGKIKYMPRDQIQLTLPHFENAFSPLANLIPLKSAVKGQRVAMGSRMLTQALPLVDAEAPLVQGLAPGKNESFEELHGRQMGAIRADKPGWVTAMDSDSMTISHPDGTTSTKQLYNHFPYNRKTYVHNTAAVNIGDQVQPGQLLAYSNYTDKSGTAALGKNLYAGYLPFRGANYEDAFVISEAAAKKLSSEHMYQHGIELTDKHKTGKRTYLGLFPSKFDRNTIANLDDDGVIKPGTVVNFGDPLILSAKERESAQNKVHRKGQAGFEDATELWKHHAPGLVTDVVKTKNGHTVLVKSIAQMQVGDKLSGRYGDKGVIADIIPDDQMPKDSQGQAFDILLNPLGLISRVNVGQVAEAALGKIAKQTGAPQKILDFDKISDVMAHVQDQLKMHGLSDTDTVTDPETGRAIPAVLTGHRFFMKLHHTSESKAQGRGTGGYTMAGEPAKGGETGSKRMSLMDQNALLSHGALEVMRDAGAIRGQRNEDYWLAFMKGVTPPKPQVPLIYNKFVNELKAAGINVVPEGNKLHVMAMTDSDIDELAGDRNINSGDTVRLEKGMEPVKGGLFDPSLTGGHDGNRWAAVKLHEPMPNPVMEEPIRRMLNLTEKKFLDILAGREKLPDGSSGPSGIRQALSKMNITKEIATARAEIHGGRKTARDHAIRKLGYLKSAQALGIHPKDWFVNRVPVLPPRFRPISAMSDTGLPLVSDPNYLYKELIDANKNLRELSTQIDDVGDERLAVYDTFKAVTGLGDPTHPKLVEKNVRGLLRHIFGSSPKLGTVQRRLISSTVDLVGRATITPDPNLDMDEVGLPEEKAWDLYKHFIIRHLARRGMPLVEAARHVKDQTELAREAMQAEMLERPVLLNRAPVLHRFGIMAFFPKLTKGATLRVSPLVTKGFGADFDGDAMQFHVPVDDRARKEAIDRMLPSRNLLSPSDMKSPVHAPTQEYVGGLYAATAGKSERRPRVFRNPQDVWNAWQRGDIDVRDKVVIMEK